MSIYYKLNYLTQNCENKILITTLCNKFLIRNQINSKTYVIENGIFCFPITIKNLRKFKKNFRKNKKKNYFSFLEQSKKQKKLERLATVKILRKTSNSRFKNKINQYKKSLILEKPKKKIYNLKGHSIRGNTIIFKSKKKLKHKLFIFFRKKKKINFLKHRLFLIKLILKLKKNKIPFSGFIKRVIKGGYICKSILFSIKAFLPKTHLLSPFKTNFKKLFLKIFKLLKNFSYEEIIKSYIIFSYKQKTNFKVFETILSRYKNKVLFPLYIGIFKKKIVKIKNKKKIKFFYKLKKKNRRLFRKKKTTLFGEQKIFHYCYYYIIFFSNGFKKCQKSLVSKDKQQIQQFSISLLKTI
jgi:hypothetical protein